jgi:hypothetical protein
LFNIKVKHSRLDGAQHILTELEGAANS